MAIAAVSLATPRLSSDSLPCTLSPGYFILPTLLQKLVIPPLKLVFEFFLHWKIEGVENLKGLRSVIFAPNHTSEMDVNVIPVALPWLSPLSPIYYVARPRDFYKDLGWRKYLYGGAFFDAWGAFAVVRGKRNYKVSLCDFIKVLNDGGSVGIFPEGHMTRNGKLQSAHGGVAYLSYATGKPVIPVAISGLYGITTKKFFTRKVRLTLRFGKSLYPQDLFTEHQLGEGAAPYKRAAQKIIDTIEEMLV